MPLCAQIVGLVDAFDAMTSSRPYRAARSVEEACEEVRRDAVEGRFELPGFRGRLSMTRAIASSWSACSTIHN